MTVRTIITSSLWLGFDVVDLLPRGVSFTCDYALRPILNLIH